MANAQTKEEIAEYLKQSEASRPEALRRANAMLKEKEKELAEAKASKDYEDEIERKEVIGKIEADAGELRLKILFLKDKTQPHYAQIHGRLRKGSIGYIDKVMHVRGTDGDNAVTGVMEFDLPREGETTTQLCTIEIPAKGLTRGARVAVKGFFMSHGSEPKRGFILTRIPDDKFR